MRPLAARDLLQVWEQGEGQHPVDRALTLLGAGCPESSWEELVTLSVGQRDALLLALRELTLGSRLDGFATCPECHGRVEFAVDSRELRAANEVEREEPKLTLTSEEVEIRFRLPDSRDLAAIVECGDAEAGRHLLVERCVLQARKRGKEIAVDGLSQVAIEALAARLAEADPLSEVSLDLRCPECDHTWPVMLDIVSFFWTEVATQAQRLLQEVHTLARAYGWREADILAMSAQRRRSYLEMAA